MHRLGDAVGARDLLIKAVSADPSNAMAHAALAAAWSALGYDTKARDEAKRRRRRVGLAAARAALAVEARHSRARRRREESDPELRRVVARVPRQPRLRPRSWPTRRPPAAITRTRWRRWRCCANFRIRPATIRASTLPRHDWIRRWAITRRATARRPQRCRRARTRRGAPRRRGAAVGRGDPLADGAVRRVARRERPGVAHRARRGRPEPRSERDRPHRQHLLHSSGTVPRAREASSARSPSSARSAASRRSPAC